MTAGPVDNNDARPGFPPTREDVFWVEAMRQLLVDSMSGLHRAAAIITALSGLGLLAYLGWLLAPWNAAISRGMTARLIPLVPAVLWAVAIYYGISVFLMRRYRYFANSPDSSRLAFQRLNRRKARYLFRAFAFWAAGVAMVLVIVLLR